MEFWIKQADHEEWRAIPAQGATLPASAYAILTRSPQPHFTISIEMYHYGPSSGETGEPPPSETQLLHQKRFTRTDEEGLGEILPLTSLEPGRWEFHCHDGDLIAELFGENQSDVLSLEILPHSQSAQPLDTPFAWDQQDQKHPEPGLPREEDPQEPQEPEVTWPSPEALETPPASAAANLSSPPTDSSNSSGSHSDPRFSLMHSRLQGAPGEVLVLTGRIACSGDLEARVYNQKQLVFENQRTIRLPGDARSAVFSIQVPLPASSWTGNLIGTLTLRGTPDSSPSTLTFTVSCQEQKNGAAASAPLRSPLFSKAPQEIPINQYRDSLDPPASEPPRQPSMPQLAQAVPQSDAPSHGDPETRSAPPRIHAGLPLDLGAASAENTPLFAARTLRKLLQICHEDLAVLEPEGSGSDPVAVSTPITPPSEAALSLPQDSLDPQAVPAPDPQPQTDWDADLSSPSQPLSGEESKFSEAEPLSLPDPIPAKEEPKPPQPESPPFRWSVVSSGSERVTPFDRARADRVHRLQAPTPQRSTQDLPLPEIWVPEGIRAGETVDVVLRLDPLEDDRLSLWIKLWVKQDRTRSILDGPRWLLDFTRIDQGQHQAITRMTIPHGTGDIVFEAWAVTSDLLRQGERTLLRRSVN